jgi:hypothetical protein
MPGTGGKKWDVWVNPNSQRQLAEYGFGESTGSQSNIKTRTNEGAPQAPVIKTEGSENPNHKPSPFGAHQDTPKASRKTTRTPRPAPKSKEARQAEIDSKNPDIQALKKAIAEGATDIRFPEGAPQHVWFMLAMQYKRTMAKKAREAKGNTNGLAQKEPWVLQRESRDDIIGEYVATSSQNKVKIEEKDGSIKLEEDQHMQDIAHLGRRERWRIGRTFKRRFKKETARLKKEGYEDDDIARYLVTDEPMSLPKRAMGELRSDQPNDRPRRSDRLREKDLSNQLADMLDFMEE